MTQLRGGIITCSLNATATKFCVKDTKPSSCDIRELRVNKITPCSRICYIQSVLFPEVSPQFISPVMQLTVDTALEEKPHSASSDFRTQIHIFRDIQERCQELT